MEEGDKMDYESWVWFLWIGWSEKVKFESFRLQEDLRIDVPFQRTMATRSSVLACRIPGMGEPGGLPSMGSHRIGHN